VMKRKVRHYYGTCTTLLKAKTRTAYSRISIHSSPFLPTKFVGIIFL
jgi:hypothetical protein